MASRQRAEKRAAREEEVVDLTLTEDVASRHLEEEDAWASRHRHLQEDLASRQRESEVASRQRGGSLQPVATPTRPSLQHAAGLPGPHPRDAWHDAEAAVPCRAFGGGGGFAREGGGGGSPDGGGGE